MVEMTTLEASEVELTNDVLAHTRYDVEIDGPMADNLLAGIHPNNWNAYNSAFLKSAQDRRNYVMAVFEVVDDPVAHTAEIVENAVATYYEKGGEAPEGFVAASAAYHITSRFTFQHTVENAIAAEIDGETRSPENHDEAVKWEKAGFDIVTDDVTYQVKTGDGLEDDDADVRINAEIDGKEVTYEKA
jgi:hypothetical protein